MMKHLKLFEGYMEPQYEKVEHHSVLPPVVSMSDRTIGQIIKMMGAWKWSENKFICEKKPGRSRVMASFQYGKPYDGIKYCRLSAMDTHPERDKPISNRIAYINISQGEDDWFRIAYKSKDDLQWFKCDQLEGLEKFLKDMDII